MIRRPPRSTQLGTLFPYTTLFLLTDALLIGPFVHGLAKPAHIVIPSVTGRGMFNMSAITAADVEVHCETNECSI